MEFLWWIFQSTTSIWLLKLCFYFVMHNWQHFCTTDSIDIYKNWCSLLTLRKGVEKLARESIKTGEEEKGCTERSRKGKGIQEIWIAELSVWSPDNINSLAEKQGHSLVPFWIPPRPAEEHLLTPKWIPSQRRRHPLDCDEKEDWSINISFRS